MIQAIDGEEAAVVQRPVHAGVILIKIVFIGPTSRPPVTAPAATAVVAVDHEFG